MQLINNDNKNKPKIGLWRKIKCPAGLLVSLPSLVFLTSLFSTSGGNILLGLLILLFVLGLPWSILSLVFGWMASAHGSPERVLLIIACVVIALGLHINFNAVYLRNSSENNP